MSFHKPAAACVALLVLGCAPAGASATTTSAVTPTITQFSAGLAASTEPVSITAGSGESLWFGLRGAAALDRSTLQGGISSHATHDNDNVVAVTAGPEGDVWFLESGGGAQVGRLEPASETITEYAEPVGAKLLGLAFGPEHELWFVGELGTEAALWRMDPATGSFVGEAMKAPRKNAKLGRLTFGNEGDIYFTEENNPAAIGAFEPGTNLFAEYALSATNGNPTGITTGPEGDIFFTETNAPSIGRLDPMTHERVEFTSGLSGGRPQQIVAGADGALYFTDSTGAIGRMSTEGTISELDSGLAKTEPWGITDGPDGNVWFTEKSNPAAVGRVTLTPGAAAAAAEHVGPTAATLAATVAPRAQETSYFFEYGTSASYGSHTATATLAGEPAPVSAASPVGGLTPSTTYHFRVVATNATGTTYGDDRSFTTTAPSVPLEALPSLPGAPPLSVEAVTEAAVIGKDAGAAPTSGTVLVQSPSGQYVPLDSPQVIPIGAVIDATKGTVRLITALPKKGKTQAVLVWGGRFKLAQSKHGNGLTKIILDGALPTCSRKGAAHMAKKKAKSRTLWAEDNHGRYSTYGANSVATVLGTEWETHDTCAGTVTRVLKGKVSVRNLHTKKTVLVTKGHSYLARR